MPSKIDNEFIDNLQNFTDSLEQLVKLLKKQSKKGGDAVNNMTSAMDGTKLKTISEDMKTLVNTTTKIDSRTKEILNEVKAARKAKEGGVFSKVSDKENKKKVVDGIKVILLISIGVLALGMAFKIIGKVDPMSVIALSIAMYTMSLAFEKISNIKGLTMKRAATVSGIMIIMSAAIMFSSFFLRWTAPISLITGFSIIFISVSLGLATYLLMKSFEKIDLSKPKVLKNILLSPLILPIISLAIVMSSFILQFTKPLSLTQAFSALLIGGILGIATFLLLKGFEKIDLSNNKVMKNALLSPLILPMIAAAIVLSSFILKLTQPVSKEQALTALAVGASMGVATFFLLKGLSKVDLTNKKTLIGIMLSPIILPIIALAIVTSSYILGMMKPIKIDHTELVKMSATIGLSVLAFLPAIIIINKFKLNKKDLLTASIGILLISATIVASSIVFSYFKPLKVDPFLLIGHSISMGISLISFLPAVYLMSKLGYKEIIQGSLGVLAVAIVISSSSWILSLGKYENSPPLEWTLGVGLNLLTFGLAVVGLGLISTLVSPAVILLGSLMTLVVAGTIVATAFILSKGTYKGGPTVPWSLGVGLSLLSFIPAMIIAGIGIIGIALGALSILLVASTIVKVSSILSTGDYKNSPSLGWAMSMGILLPVFGLSMITLGTLGLLGGGVMAAGVLMLIGLSNAIVESSKILAGGTYSGGPTLEWSQGVATAIGTFANALSVSLNAGKSTFEKIFGGGGGTTNDFINFIKIVSEGIKQAAVTLSGGKYTGGPTYDWSRGVAISITAFANAISSLDNSDFNPKKFSSFIGTTSKAMVDASKTLSGGVWNKYPSNEWNNAVRNTLNTFILIKKHINDPLIDSVNKFADAIKNLSDNFSSLNDSGISKLSSFSASINVMSSFNPTGLSNNITAIDLNKEKLKNITNVVSGQPTTTIREPQLISKPNTQNNKQEIKLDSGDISGRLDKLIKGMDNIIEQITKGSTSKNAGKTETV